MKTDAELIYEAWLGGSGQPPNQQTIFEQMETIKGQFHELQTAMVERKVNNKDEIDLIALLNKHIVELREFIESTAV